VVHPVCTGQSRDLMAAIVEIGQHDVINAQNEAGASPLMLACQDGDTDLVYLQGWLLCVAVDCITLFKVLCECKYTVQTEVGAKYAAGMTALHYCTEPNNGVITSLFLRHQHDLIDVTDNEGLHGCQLIRHHGNRHDESLCVCVCVCVCCSIRPDHPSRHTGRSRC
jgi:ankyrin repeat protein